MATIIPVASFDCVVFGATGDLTARKLLPALFYRFRDGQIPETSRIIGASRSELSLDAFREHARDALKRFVPAADLTDAMLARFLDHVDYVAVDGAGDSGWDRPRGQARRAARPGPALLPRHLARPLRLDLPQPRGPRARRREVPRRAGEADRQGPEIGQGDQRRGRRGLPRIADLPHRPLSRQGDGPEPAVAPLRQHHLRAALDLGRDRPRPDHGRRDGGGRGPRPATTTRRARCATCCRTTSCSSSASPPWRARSISRRIPSGTRS